MAIDRPGSVLTAVSDRDSEAKEDCRCPVSMRALVVSSAGDCLARTFGGELEGSIVDTAGAWGKERGGDEANTAGVHVPSSALCTGICTGT